MKKRSDANNPEQKTSKTSLKHKVEMGREIGPVDKLKAKNQKKSQPIRSKQP